MKRAIQVLLIDDHRLIREGLRSLLEKRPDMEVVGEAGDGHGAVALVREIRPDVAVMDISMPELNGIDATRQITAESDTRVVCLSVHTESHLIRAMLQAGASGYLIKDSAAEELVQAIQVAARGQTYLSPAIAADVVVSLARNGGGERTNVFGELTEREREVLQLIASGLSTKEIASRLCLSPKTIHTHRENMMGKLGIDSVVELAKYALRQGLIEL